ncbi:MAG TPA: ion transporter [Thermodesulfobacteriota bacterium]|nr:ion transporter [Thermodesulfobacteriota bacterium]
MLEKLKYRIHDVMEPDDTSPVAEQIFVLSIMGLIVLNVIAVILETVDSIEARFGAFFNVFNDVSIVIFTVEYLLRLWTCTVDERYRHPVTGRIKYIFSAFALVDLIAILPFYLPFVTTVDLRFLRVLRLLTLLKMTRYADEFKLFGNVLRAKRREIVISAILVLMLIILSSSLMYYIEHDKQPEAFSSIPAAMWWAVVTLSTVGYGDVLPLSPLGKLVAACVSMLGIALFAIPAGIIASGFVEEMRKKESVVKICPHCGKRIGE